MARVELSLTAVGDLLRLTRTLSLPDDTAARVVRSLSALADFPGLGAPLSGRWSGYRFLLGPWRWMVLVYVHLEAEHRVVVVTIEDARSGGSPTVHR